MAALPLATLQAIHPGIAASIYGVLTLEASVASRVSLGGTAPDNVRRAAALWIARLAGEKADAEPPRSAIVAQS